MLQRKVLRVRGGCRLFKFGLGEEGTLLLKIESMRRLFKFSSSALVDCAAASFAWLAPALVFFVAGAAAKRAGKFTLYALAHGLWHAASAVAIGLIVLREVALFGSSTSSVVEALEDR